MEIAVNTRLLIKNKIDGIGRFTYETLKHITQNHPEDHFYFFFDREYDEEFIFADNITPIVVGPQARHPFLFYWWFEKSVAPILDKLNVDVFLSPDGFLPLSSNVKMLPVFHDLNYFHYPKDVPWLVKKYYHYFIPKFALKATRVATVSEFSKKDIRRQLAVPLDKIDVVYNGVSDIFRPIDDVAQKQAVRDKYTSGSPYFIFVGSLHPRKNISNLLLAFDKFKINSDYKNKLVIAGAKYYWTSEMESILKNMKFKNDVVFTGRLPDEEVASLIASANALTYVPYFEGFGLPIIEAMKCGVPVITSKVTSMPEVAKDAAILVDPFDTTEIMTAMGAIEQLNHVRVGYKEKGLRRAEDFSWAKTAELLYASIEKTVKGG